MTSDRLMLVSLLNLVTRDHDTGVITWDWPYIYIFMSTGAVEGSRVDIAIAVRNQGNTTAVRMMAPRIEEDSRNESDWRLFRTSTVTGWQWTNLLNKLSMPSTYSSSVSGSNHYSIHQIPPANRFIILVDKVSEKWARRVHTSSWALGTVMIPNDQLSYTSPHPYITCIFSVCVWVLGRAVDGFLSCIKCFPCTRIFIFAIATSAGIAPPPTTHTHSSLHVETENEATTPSSAVATSPDLRSSGSNCQSKSLNNH